MLYSENIRYQDQIVHVSKLFSLLHWSQNIFCFLCSSTPSHVGKFFRLQWEFQWENDQNKKNGQKSLFRGPKWFPKCLNGGFRGGICIEKWSQNFDSGTRSAIFGAPQNAENGCFWLFWGYRKWHFQCPNQNSKTTFQYKYPP